MSSKRVEDPQAEREAQRYDKPIASREMLLQVITDHGGPITFRRLVEELGYDDPDDREALHRRLRAMERDGQIIRNRRGGYVPVAGADLVRGRVIGHPDGFGFLQPDEGGDDLFLSPRQMRSLFHGDRAVAQVIGVDRRGRPEGALVEVIERAHEEVVGRLVLESGVAFVSPDNKRLVHDILVPEDALAGAEDGQIVRAAIVEQPSGRKKPVGRIVEVLGDHMAPGMEIDVAIATHEIPATWPESVEKVVAGMSEEVAEADKLGRVDLRHLPLVTIDGEDTKDFDDAVFAQATPKGWRLLVAIADVSHYVTPDNPLDAEAFRRATSVYFPGTVVPMLPEILSNGLCSINPRVDRLCLACEMQINREGRIIRSRFFEGVMQSHERLTYGDVADMVQYRKDEARERFAHVLENVDTLYDVYKVLAESRRQRGAIEFETTETKVRFGEGRKIEAIVPVERNDAHKLIEECMIAANVATARFLKRHRISALYRVHDAPATEKLEDLNTFLGEMGLPRVDADDPEPDQLNRVLDAVAGKPEAHMVQTAVLRTMKQAVYSPDNIGHFGLAHDNYTHFTSPIRRYPDLIVHRAIRHVLRTGGAEGFQYSHDMMLGLGEHCSTNERRADEATRDAMDWLKCEYMLDKVGEVFDGVVATVTSFGLFVELQGVFVEGLVHVTNLDKDYYRFDPVHHRLAGERSGRTYRVGDRIRVQVARVDLDDRKIDLALPETGEDTAGDAGEEAPAGGEGAGEGGGKPRRKSRSRRRSGRSRTARDKSGGKSGEQGPPADPGADADGGD